MCTVFIHIIIIIGSVLYPWVNCPGSRRMDVVSATGRSYGVAPRACVRLYARVLVPPNLYIHTYIHTYLQSILCSTKLAL